MSENKKKESDADSQSLPDDVLQVLDHASEEDEAEFLDALSLDVDDELGSSLFPELGLNEVPEEVEEKDPFGLASDVSKPEPFTMPDDEAPPPELKEDLDEVADLPEENDATEFETMAVEDSGRSPLIDLKNADYIKFAQDKIKNLEKQLFDLRSECEELARAGDHFKNIADERGQKIKALEARVDESYSLAVEEKKILQESPFF